MALAYLMWGSHVSEHEEVARRCLSAALGRSLLPEENPVRGKSEDWDSLKHVELMFVVEDETGEIMSPDQLASIVDLASLEAVLADLDRSE